MLHATLHHISRTTPAARVAAHDAKIKPNEGGNKRCFCTSVRRVLSE